MSFPLNSNQAYIKDNGTRSTLGQEIAGGSSPELPTYSETDAGKVLTVGEDGTLEWDEKGAEAGALVGTTVPDASLGVDGDYYYKRTQYPSWMKSHTALQSAGRKEYGTEFIANSAFTITKIKGMTTSSKTGTLVIGSTTTVAERSESLSFAANEWTEYELTTPYTVAAGDHFIIQMEITSGSTGDIAYCNDIVYDMELASWYKGRYSTFPGTSDNTKTMVDFSYGDGETYYVDGQYLKASGTWRQL